MKKKIIIAASVVGAVFVIGVLAWTSKHKNSANAKEEVVYVEKVAAIMGLGSGMGAPGRFQGVVESQKTWEVQQSTDKIVKDILVEVGQEVEEGTPLFTYNTATMESELSQAELDLERIENDRENLKGQITQLEKEKKDASAEEKLAYTTKILTAQTDLKKNEYEKKSKAVAIEQLRTNISNATVLSAIKGVVKSINKATSNPGMTGENQAFMTIMATGDFRVKGKVSEQNLSAIVEGQPAIIRSRVDSSKTWSGTYGKIDVENPNTDQAQGGGMVMMGGNSKGQEKATSYSFFVSMDSTEGLLLGQHVYIEANAGQETVRNGIWIEEGFINSPEENPYVWAEDTKGKIEKRAVVLGTHDENLSLYEIKEGLNREDAIAFPQETIKVGKKVTTQPQQGEISGGTSDEIDSNMQAAPDLQMTPTEGADGL